MADKGQRGLGQIIPEGGATFAAGGGLLLEVEIFMGARPSPCPSCDCD